MTNTPYLSVVATARNDDHGGKLLHRMQIFINGLLEQCKRYNLPAELILVEWNPPRENLKLVDVLSWEHQPSPCSIRIIEVAPELHDQFRHADVMPLFQMMAKNVGIRRARGQFVLATNIDILFSDKLFQFIASRRLNPGAVYRVDRHDVRPFVPLEASLDQQLAYCRQNTLRINRKDTTEQIQPMEPEPSEPGTSAESSELVGNTIEEQVSLESSRPSRLEAIPSFVTPVLQILRQGYRRLFPSWMKDSLLRQLPPSSHEWLIRRNLLSVQTPVSNEPDPASLLATESESLSEPELFSLPSLHLNACGDFTLMAREPWFKVRGYPEFELHGLHLDSILCFAIHQLGLKERILEDDMQIYHIEHGRTWIPDSAPETVMDVNVANRMPKLSWEQLKAIGLLMQQIGRPLIVNQENWGLADLELPETEILENQTNHPSFASNAWYRRQYSN
jgi:hypothetical protein